MPFAAMMMGGQYATGEGGSRCGARAPGGQHPPLLTQSHQHWRRSWLPGQCDEQISWPTAERTASDLACAGAVGYSVNPWIDGKEKVYGSIP
jgi:hypothetical protein